MASANMMLFLLLTVTTLANSQQIFFPGAEPWAFLVQVACHTKKVDIYMATTTAAMCMTRLVRGDPNRLAICNKKRERNNCLEPYYDHIKNCFDDDKKADVDIAFEAQKEFINFMCADDGERFTDIKPEDLLCVPNFNQSCMESVMRNNIPDPSQLFAENNCKTIHGVVECSAQNFENCETTVMKDLIHDQMNSALGKTPCGKVNENSTFSAFAAAFLIFTHLCQGLIKAIF